MILSTLMQPKERKEVSSHDMWDVDVLYPTLTEWEKEFASATESPSAPHFPSLVRYKGHLHEGPSVLKEALEKLFTLSRKLEKLYTYVHLRHDEEITHNDHKNAYQRACLLLQDFGQECAWFEPELLALTPETMSQYLESSILAPYRFHLEKILRMRPHTLSADKEELLAMAAKPLQTSPQAFSALNNADIKFGVVKNEKGEDKPLSHALYSLYLRSPDRTLRKNAFESTLHRYADLENTLSELIYGEMQSHTFFAKARHFDSCLDAALFPKNIDTAVYRSLIDTMKREGISLLHEYTRIRKKILKLPSLHFYDSYVPLVADVDMHMSYEEAEALVIESVAPLGEEYQQLLKKGLQQQRWVDRFENKNKRSGAYSSGCYDSHPYILMNYKGILHDVFTLAHEAGHSMHSLLSHTHQPYHYSQYPIFVAEVASTFNEELLTHMLLKRTQKKEERLFLLGEKIEDIRGTLFRQTMFAEFELHIHELVEKGTPLTPSLLKEIYLKLNQEYFGPHMEIDDLLAVEWGRIPHFYYNFYVYQYATGISAALALSQKVLAGDGAARDAYLAFLKGGSSLFPIDLLKLAGVDMTTSAPVSAALQTFKSLLAEFEKTCVD